MNLTIHGHHLEITPALREYVSHKLDRIERHFDHVVKADVLLTIKKQKQEDLRQHAECRLHVKGKDLFVHTHSANLYAAVDELAHKLDRQIVAHKTRVQDHHHSAKREGLQASQSAMDAHTLH